MPEAAQPYGHCVPGPRVHPHGSSLSPQCQKPALEPCFCPLSGSVESAEGEYSLELSNWRRWCHGRELRYRLSPAGGAPRLGRNRETGGAGYGHRPERTLQNGVKSCYGLQKQGERSYQGCGVTLGLRLNSSNSCSKHLPTSTERGILQSEDLPCYPSPSLP